MEAVEKNIIVCGFRGKVSASTRNLDLSETDSAKELRNKIDICLLDSNLNTSSNEMFL